jgi:hypothetical protein
LNVLEPTIVIAKAPVVAFQKLLNTNPAFVLANDLFAVNVHVNLIVDDHAFNVRFVLVDIVNGFVVQLNNVHVQLHIVIDRTLEFDDRNSQTVTS